MLKCAPVTPHRLRQPLRITLVLLGGILLGSALLLLAGWLDAPLSQVITNLTQRQPKPSWPAYFRQAGMLLLAAGLLLLLGEKLVQGFERLLEGTDRWLAQRVSGFLRPPAASVEWPLRFHRWDAAIILFFVLIASVYQLAMLSPGYPNVILSGDAANIASFAAARAYPERFENDVLLSDARHLGLYVTVHLPVAIWLEKLVGNFGLAYRLLLFPHVFLQYFSYYLFGRVVLHRRYWAFLFSLAASAPLAFAGGELWGVVSDAMPRFTFQVILPWILILLLAPWRHQPTRWYWIMILCGLLAFVHPVSAPVWAFTLWLGFWHMFPPVWESRRKLWEMCKLGGTLCLAILPYVSIYIRYHDGGSSPSNYDLTYYILQEFFPENLLNIPAAVMTFLRSTSQFGLLWYALAGLLLTFLLFREERPRLKQMLVWMGGILIISVLVPWVENIIERALRIIPLQTELMRGMRYLVPFLVMFWFAPFAELTRRLTHPQITRAVFAAGTVLTLGWLAMNPPEPFKSIPDVLNCWQRGQFLCPNNLDHANALTYIREELPEGSKFAVFLTNRWSGIEVRYLSLRPMVYAFKDRGQLVYTNVEALEEWYALQQREAEIFSRRKTPTLEEKRTLLVEFARDAGAEYILTNFPFPAEAQHQLNVDAVYQNATYSVLQTHAPPP